MNSVYIGRKRLSPSFHHKKKEIPSFLVKLYQILENAQYKGIIEWDETGKLFIIKNLNEFCEKVLPIYYKHNNYSSFVRQLNMYDFHKIRNKDNFIIYEHTLFYKDGKGQIAQIKRKSKQNENGLVLLGEKGKKVDDDVLIENNLNNKTGKKNNKKTLAKTLNALIEKAKRNEKKQNEIESKINILNNANNNLLSENKVILQEISNKTEYNKKLESIVLFVIELLFKKPSNTINTEQINSPIANKTDQLILKKENDISNFFQRYMEVIKKDNEEEIESKLENSKMDYNLNQIFGSSSTLPQDSTENSNINNQHEEDIYLNDNELCFDNSLNAINTQDITKDLSKCFFNLNDG